MILWDLVVMSNFCVDFRLHVFPFDHFPLHSFHFLKKNSFYQNNVLIRVYRFCLTYLLIYRLIFIVKKKERMFKLEEEWTGAN